MCKFLHTHEYNIQFRVQTPGLREGRYISFNTSTAPACLPVSVMTCFIKHVNVKTQVLHGAFALAYLEHPLFSVLCRWQLQHVALQLKTGETVEIFPGKEFE